MTRHEQMVAARVVPQYEIDTLGAPFKVTISNCVTLKVDPATGKELVNIPDLVGLINAVVRTRVMHPRKLNGKEIKFIRNALGVKANALAGFLEMSPEHFSRCEASAKVMSAISERFFRLFAYLATCHPEPEKLLVRPKGWDELGKEIEQKEKKPDEMLKRFAEQFITMKIQSAFDAEDELHFEFSREPVSVEKSERTVDQQDAEWEPKLNCCNY